MKLKNKAFTLLEVVLGLGLGGIILTSVLTFFVAFLSSWNSSNSKNNFYEHIDACVRYLSIHLNDKLPVIQNSLIHSDITIQKINTGILSSATQYSITGLLPNSINFLKNGSGFGYGPTYFALNVANNKLMLYWQSPKITKARFTDDAEESNEKLTINKVVLSEYVKKMDFAFIDKSSKKWKFVTTEEYAMNPKKFDKCPDGLLFTFFKDDNEEKRFVSLLNRKHTICSLPTNTNQVKIPNKQDEKEN